MTQSVTTRAAVEIAPAADPLYLQVHSAISRAIREGRLAPGDRLPTEREFCEQLSVSRATVRRALRQLVEEGLVEATVGRGSFVRSDYLAEPPNTLMSFSELAAARGLVPSSRILRQVVRPTTLEEASAFGIEVLAVIFELERLRSLDKAPVAVDRTRIPLAFAPDLPDQDFTDASVYSALDRAGVAPVTADAIISAIPADAGRASHLGVERNTPLLLGTTVSYDARGRVVEISEIAYRHDRYQFHAKLSRRPAETTGVTQ
jgi:GntR family transcriptional regulator